MREIKIEIYERDHLKIRVNTQDYKYLKELHKYFQEKVPNYFHMPQYRSGFWDGTVSVFNKQSRTIPYGLFFEYLKFHKDYENPPELKVAPDVKRLFKGPKLTPKYDLKLKPYNYQRDCIKAALDHTKGIIRSATASGKSLMIAYIIKTLADNFGYDKNRTIIIVPTKGLITQFVKDLTEYGIEESLIGTVYAKSKQFKHPIVVSTWQTLSKNHDSYHFTKL